MINFNVILLYISRSLKHNLPFRLFFVIFSAKQAKRNNNYKNTKLKLLKTKYAAQHTTHNHNQAHSKQRTTKTRHAATAPKLT